MPNYALNAHQAASLHFVRKELIETVKFEGSNLLLFLASEEHKDNRQ
jgi:hypothetical protein